MKIKSFAFFLALSASIISGTFAFAADEAKKTTTSGKPSIQGLSVTSSFRNGQAIAKQFTADGTDVSPALRWSQVPAATKSIAIVCSDPDAPRGTWYHWLLWNLPAKTPGLNQNVPKSASIAGGTMQGTNDFGKLGYNGPAPPPGATHHYHFRVYALDTTLSVHAGARKDELLSALQGHIVAEGEVVGTYSR